MLLIVTQSEFDPTVDNMEIQLRARGVDYVRWDPASYPVASGCAGGIMHATRGATRSARIVSLAIGGRFCSLPKLRQRVVVSP